MEKFRLGQRCQNYLKGITNDFRYIKILTERALKLSIPVIDQNQKILLKSKKKILNLGKRIT